MVEKRNEIFENYSNARHLEEMQKCRSGLKGFTYWIETYGTIEDTIDGAPELVTFKLFPYQEKIVNDLFHYKLIIIGKSRQLGISYLLAHYVLWNAIFFSNVRIPLASMTEKDAMELFDKVLLTWDWLPSWMKPDVLTRTTKVLRLGRREVIAGKEVVRGRNSKIHICANTRKLARGQKPFLMIQDEAFHTDGFKGAYPSVMGTRARSQCQVILSGTPNPGTDASEFCTEIFLNSGKKDSQFEDWHRIFCPWPSDPRRDETWEIKEKRSLGHLFRYEHPAVIEDFIMATDQCFFDPELLNKDIQIYTAKSPEGWIEGIPGNLQYTPFPVDGTPRFLYEEKEGGLHTLWKPPVLDHDYVIGCDPTGGGSKGDDAVAYVMDCNTCELVASLVGKIEPDVLAVLLRDLGLYYNTAFIGVEANQGTAVNVALISNKECDYPNVYLRESLDELNPSITQKLGFFMSGGANGTKFFSYTQFSIAWRTGKIKYWDLNLLYEMQNIQLLGPTKVGKVGHRPDNRPDAAVITFQMYQARPTYLRDAMKDKQYHEALEKAYEQLTKIQQKGRSGLIVGFREDTDRQKYQRTLVM